jgi:hypothetical protein
MSTSTQVISAEIPDVLKTFYSGVGKPGETGYAPGLIERGINAIYPGGLSGQAAYQAQYAPVFQAGLMGTGSVAGLSPFQTAVGQKLGTMGMPDQYSLGTQAGQAAASGLQGLQDYQASALNAPSTFDASVAKQYMSPYMQEIVDRQQQAAIKAAKESQLGQNLAAARQGTYGGARQALLQGQREGMLQSQLGEIQAKGLQSAYENAQAQFERDRAAGFNVEKANQAADIAAAQQRLAAAQGLTTQAGTFGQLGTQQRAAELDTLKTQGAFGDLQRAIQQQQMDAQRQMLMDQSQYGQTQVGQLSNLLRGVPMQSATQTTTTPPPSFASQLTGLGLTGIGLYNMLGGGKG